MNGRNRHKRDRRRIIVKREQTLNEERQTRSYDRPGAGYIPKTQNIKISLCSLQGLINGY